MTRGFLLYGGRREAISVFALALILIIGAMLRWYELAWDEGYLFHPDERQILLVASNLNLPSAKGLLDVFSSNSPLNPHFFAYGSFPIYLLRILSPLAPPSAIMGPWANDFLARWIFFGRSLSGLFDLGTVALIYLLGRNLYSRRVGLIAAACVTLTVLHIQLSHFYAVDTMLTFFVVATLYAALRVANGTTRVSKIICGITFGLALATKLSALPLVIPIAYACWRPMQGDHPSTGSGQAPSAVLRAGSASPLRRARIFWNQIHHSFVQICGVALATFIFTQPYTLLDPVTFARDAIREGFLARGWLDYPYTLQFANTLPYIYQIVQGTVWGMGLPLGIFAWTGGALLVWNAWRTRRAARLAHPACHRGAWRREQRAFFLISWALVYFILIGGQYTKYLRYLLPLLPILYLMAAKAFLQINLPRGWVTVGIAVVLTLSGLYALAFDSIYGREHPWLTASRWIYLNLAPGSTLLVEEWDEALPVTIQLNDGEHRATEYHQVLLRLYAPDDDEKLNTLATALTHADAVILSSQRAYSSIARLPERYPITARYYEKLFDGELGFDLAANVQNDIALGGITIRDDPRYGLPFDTLINDDDANWDWGSADESFSVYDHPQPLIFVKRNVLSYSQIYSLLEP